MSDYIKREDAIDVFDWGMPDADVKCGIAIQNINDIPSADVVEADKVQKEIDYWHDKAQSYEQTILKLSLNKADVVEVVRCKDCKYRKKNTFCLHNMRYEDDNGFCSYGERGRYER